jgi:hypothetical protein
MSKSNQANVLITAGAGYLGSVLASTLLHEGFGVTVLDNFLFGQNSLMDCCGNDRFRIIRGDVRNQKVVKGSFKDVNIREVMRDVRGSGLNVISNYIFGFPDDNIETMQETLDLALELCTEMANMYPCQALPGSPLYNTAKDMGWKLPESPEGFAFLSFDCLPLPTKHLSASEVLRFRDHAWHTYFQYTPFLDLVERKFGAQERRNVEDMASIKLKRKLLGEN